MRKILSLTLALVMVFGMTTVAFAIETDLMTAAGGLAADEASNDGSDWNFIRIDRFTSGKARVEQTNIGTLWDGEVGDVVPGSDIHFAPYDETLTEAFSSKSKISMTMRKTTGAIAIDTASIKYDKDKALYIQLEMSEPVATTKERTAFEATFTFTAGKGRVYDSGTSGTNLTFTVSGDLLNDLQVIYDDDIAMPVDELGSIFEADSYNKGVELELNEDVSIVTRAFAGSKYYAYVSHTPDSKAAAIIDEYKAIESYAHFTTINLNSSSVRFYFADNNYAYYLDDEDNLVYAGRTNEDLPYPLNHRYFVANRELDLPVVGGEEPVEEPIDAPIIDEPAPTVSDGTDNAAGGPVDEAPSAANNFNPGTGR